MLYDLEKALDRRRRRLREDIRDVQDAVTLEREDADAVVDAVEGALESLSRLAEGLKVRQLRNGAPTPFTLAKGDVGGETTFGLVYARGHNTHKLIDLYDRYGFGTHPFGEGPLGGGWAWVPDAEPEPKYSPRDEWYAAHVAHHLLEDPLGIAVAWLDEKFPALVT
jgi:hypothetical protein